MPPPPLACRPTKSELLAPRHDHGDGPSMVAMAKEIGADRCIFQARPPLQPLYRPLAGRGLFQEPAVMLPLRWVP